MKTLLITTILLFSSFLVKGQEDSILGIPSNALSWFNPITNTDSLKILLKDARDHARADLLCELAYSLNRADRGNKNIAAYLDEALKLSENLDYNNGKVKTYFLLGDYYRISEPNPKECLLALEHAASFIDTQIHWTLRYRVWSALGKSIFRQNGNAQKALFYYDKALVNLDKDTAWIAHVRSHLWIMHHATISDYPQKWAHMKELHGLLQENKTFFSHKGFALLNHAEELSINLANYGEYQWAAQFMHWVLEVLDDQEQPNLYTEFFSAKILGRIGRIYSHWGKPDSALVFINSAIPRFDKIYEQFKEDIDNPATGPTYRLWLINAVNQLEERADVYIRTGNYNQAEKDLLESIEIRTQYPDPLGIAMCYDKLGEVYALRGNFLEALQWYDSSLKIKYEVVENEISKEGIVVTRVLFARESIATTYLKKGRLFKTWNRIQPALAYFSRSLSASREAGFQRGEAEALIEMGNLHRVMQQNLLAMEFYQQAATIYQTMGHRPGGADVMEKMGDFYYHQGNIAEAVVNYQQSLDIFEELDMPARTAALLIRQGNLLAAEHEIHEAINKYAEALRIAEQINLPRLKMEAFQGLADCYSSLGYHKDALAAYKNSREIRDALFTLEVERQMAEIEAAHETRQNRQQLLLLQREKELMEEKGARSDLIILGMIVFIAVLLIFISMYFRQNRLKNGHERILLQQKLFRSQMNPHFIFNSLGSIQSSIINEEPRVAVKYLSRFSKLMRSILDSSIHETIPLSKELSTIENYLALQKARFPQKFDYLISGADDLDTESLCVPPMLAQPFIENAIEHGIKHKETKGLVNVSYHLSANILTIVIEDDGIGRKKAGELLKKHDKDHVSMAIDITRQRIEVLNRRSRHPIRFQIEDLSKNSGQPAGTRVVFAVPV